MKDVLSILEVSEKGGAVLVAGYREWRVIIVKATFFLWTGIRITVGFALLHFVCLLFPCEAGVLMCYPQCNRQLIVSNKYKCI